MQQKPAQLNLKYRNYCRGDVTVPGSKSLSNRALLLAALCEGETQIVNLLESDDINHMLTALKKLGVESIIADDKQSCIVKGVGGKFKQPSGTLYLGNAGTAMRPLAAVLAVTGIESELTGEPRMYERPIRHLIDALKPLNNNISYKLEDGFPPLLIGSSEILERQLTVTKSDSENNSLEPITISINGSISSQYLTALLMAMPLLPFATTINVTNELVSKPYISLTLDIMKKFGVTVKHNDMQSFHFSGSEKYQSPNKYMVEGDASSASYFLAAGAISGGPVRVFGIGKSSVQGDVQFAEAIKLMGASIEYHEDHLIVSREGRLSGIEIDCNHIPDAAMTLGTLALFADGTTKITNIYNWRVKETDRLFAMATELKKVGATVIEGDDYLSVTPPSTISHAEIDTYDDHRIAMCFSLLAFNENGITINDPEVTSKTFPDYFDRFEQLTQV